MKIIGLFFMTLVFGIISMITSKKYKLQGDLKELCFPPVFFKIFIWVFHYFYDMFSGYYIFMARYWYYYFVFGYGDY